MVGAAAAGIALRWSSLGAESLWFDEGHTAWVGSLPWSRQLEVIRGDTAPPLYYFLLRAWILVFGDSEAALRSLSAAFGTAGIGLFYALARRLLRTRPAVVAAAWMFALTSIQIAYAREARYYSLMSLLGLSNLLLLLRFEESRTPARSCLLVLSMAMSLYTQNLMAFSLLALGIAWFLLPSERPFRRRARDIGLVATAVLLLYLPWLPSLLEQWRFVRESLVWAVTPTFRVLADTIVTLAGADILLDRNAPEGGPGMWAALLCVASCGLLGAARRRSGWMLGVYSLLPIAIVFVLSHVCKPIFVDRVFIGSGATLPLLLAMAADLQEPPGRRRLGRAVALGVMCPLVLASGFRFAIPGTEPREDWRAASRHLLETKAERQLLLFLASEGQLLFDYYSRRTNVGMDRSGIPRGFFDEEPPRTMRRVQSRDDLASLDSAIASGKYEKIVLVVSHRSFADPQGLAYRRLERAAKIGRVARFRGITVIHFAIARRVLLRGRTAPSRALS